MKQTIRPTKKATLLNPFIRKIPRNRARVMAMKQFKHDVPQLRHDAPQPIENNEGKWVAYLGNILLGHVAHTPKGLCVFYRNKGLDVSQLEIFQIPAKGQPSK